MSIDTPTATRLLEEALISHGYHGLYLADPVAGEDCSCLIGDLMPCGIEPSSCRAGWLQPLEHPDADFTIGPTTQLTTADLEAIGQQRLIGLSDEETE